MNPMTHDEFYRLLEAAVLNNDRFAISQLDKHARAERNILRTEACRNADNLIYQDKLGMNIEAAQAQLAMTLERLTSQSQVQAKNAA